MQTETLYMLMAAGWNGRKGSLQLIKIEVESIIFDISFKTLNRLQENADFSEIAMRVLVPWTSTTNSLVNIRKAGSYPLPSSMIMDPG